MEGASDLHPHLYCDLLCNVCSYARTDGPKIATQPQSQGLLSSLRLVGYLLDELCLAEAPV